jgi:hypothetical protein
VKGRLINELRDSGSAGKGELAAKQAEWMSKVTMNIPEIMATSFKGKMWSQLSFERAEVRDWYGEASRTDQGRWRREHVR